MIKSDLYVTVDHHPPKKEYFTMSGKYALSIDCFQRLREVGYLGNPASFTGTYLSYIEHEALYFDYENTHMNIAYLYLKIICTFFHSNHNDVQHFF